MQFARSPWTDSDYYNYGYIIIMITDPPGSVVVIISACSLPFPLLLPIVQLFACVRSRRQRVLKDAYGRAGRCSGLPVSAWTAASPAAWALARRAAAGIRSKLLAKKPQSGGPAPWKKLDNVREDLGKTSNIQPRQICGKFLFGQNLARF